MADYTVRVVAETKEADDKVKKLDKDLSSLEKERKIHFEIPSLSETIENVKALGSTLQTTYKIARNVPVIGPRIQDVEELGDIAATTGQKIARTFQIIASATPGKILTTSFAASTAAANELAQRISHLGFALFGITEAVGVVKAAFGGMFEDTIGREIKLRESILRTKTTLASTADVVRNGKVIADPFQAIAALDGPINKTIESIRTRSLSIAGTTSDAIIQVFGTVATSISSVGGSLKDAEDLAISFSAALGTMGLSDPYYAVQEIRSIMTGNIDNNSILARSLGLTNEEVAKAKSSSEGLVKFLQKRLAAFTAGQSMAAKAYAGLTSNLQEFSEEFKRAFGRELLDPLLEGLTVLYQRLELIFKSAFGVASAVGKAFAAVARGVVGAAAAAPSLSKLDNTAVGQGAERGNQLAAQGAVAVQEAIDKLRPQIATLSDQFIRAFAMIGTALAKLAQGFAIFKFEEFKVYLTSAINLASILNSTVIPAVTALISAYGELLKQPVVQYVSQLGAQFDVLNRAGILPLAKTLFVLKNVVPSVISTFRALGQGFTWVKVQLAGLVDLIITGFSAAIAGASTLIANLGRAIVSGLMMGISALLVGLKAVVVQLGIFLIQVAELVQQAAPQFGALAISIAQVGKALLGVEVAFEKAQIAVAEFGLKTASALDALQLKTDQVRGKVEGAGQSIKDGIDGAAKSVGQNIKSMVMNMLWFSAQLVLLQVAITVLVDAYSKWRRSQQEISDQTRAELAVKRLSTAYADLGESATAAQRALKELEEQKLSSRIADLKTKIGELDAAIERASNIRRLKNFGDALKQVAASLNFNNFDVRPQLKGDGTQETFVEALMRTRKEQYRAAQEELNRLAEAEKRIQDKAKAQDDIKLQAKVKKDLEKEIAELQRQHQNELFQQRQALAQKEVEIFRAAGELRIQQMERANKKLIEGEEGASRTALEALNTYLSTRERGELEIETAKQNLAVEVTNMEQRIADYRYEIEKKIFDLRKRAGENDIASAQARQALAANSGGAVAPGAFGALSAIIGGVESYGGNYGAFNRGGSNNGHTAHGSGIDANLTNMTIAEIQRRQLAPNVPKNQQLHAVGKYQIIGGTLRGLLNGSYGATGVTPDMKFTPEVQEALGAALARNRVVPGSVNQTMAGLRREWIGLQNVPDAQLIPAVKALMAGGSTPILGASAAATPSEAAPALQGRADLGDGKRQADELAASVRNVASAMERLRALQAALTDARTAEAFDAIAESIFQPVGLESLQDQLAEVQLNYEAIASSSADALNPERTAIEVAAQVKVNAAIRERGQIEQFVNASTLLSATEKAKLLAEIEARHQKYVESLRQEESIQKAILAVQQGMDLTKRWQSETTDIYREIAATRERLRLEMQGMSPERVAAELAKLRIRQDLADTQKVLNERLTEQLALIKKKEDQLDGATSNKEKEQLLKELAEAQAEIESLNKLLENLPTEGYKRQKAEDDKAANAPTEVENLMARWQQELEDTDAMVASLAQTIQSELASAMSNAVIGVIDGTTTVGEAFGQMFKNIGKAFVDMATQMLAQKLFMTVLGALIPGGSPLGNPAGSGGNVLPGGWQQYAFADGGFVTGPTRALIGEGGEPEYVIPASKMRTAMGRYSAGARGSSVIPGGSDGGDAGGTATMATAPIDVRYSVERINNVDYVTADQFQAGMAQAAQQGAIQGERRALRTLQSSAATRKRIGV